MRICYWRVSSCVTGSISRYAMLVCDCEDEWNVYMYSDYLEDIVEEEDIVELGLPDRTR